MIALYRGRPLRGIDFATDGVLKLRRFDALDYFEDGSLYLLNAPGVRYPVSQPRRFRVVLRSVSNETNVLSTAHYRTHLRTGSHHTNDLHFYGRRRLSALRRVSPNQILTYPNNLISIPHHKPSVCSE